VHDFWYHALWTAKKLRRGEAATARFCLEGLMKGLLVELAREQAARLRPEADTWHRTRFVERWADPRAAAAIWAATARDPEELPAALRRLCDAFDELAAEILPPDPGAAAARARLRDLLPAT
jgi:aminoglycoside 6-adenylyltransferase